MKIFIDAGHNHSGADTGAQGNGLREQDVTFSIADKLRALFVSAGHEVAMSRSQRTENVGTSLSDSLKKRVELANTWGANLFISIHCNAYDGKASGTETLVYSFGSQAAEYGERIQHSVVTALGTENRGVKERKDLAVLRLTAMPAVLIETAFIDNPEDAILLRDRHDDFAKAIYEGITGSVAKEEVKMEQTVMKLPSEVYIQEINPEEFKIIAVDKAKKGIALGKYFNCGFFTEESGGKTIPVGNLASDGVVLSNARENASWINVSGHKLTTIYTAERGISGNVACFIEQTDDIRQIPQLKTAVSGIPIIVGGKRVSLEEIKAEGYFGNELYNTWHGFLGIRHNKLVYVAMKCEFNQMCWALVALGIYDAIKLDGGGSFILHDVKDLEATAENRRIHNVGVWEK